MARQDLHGIFILGILCMNCRQAIAEAPPGRSLASSLLPPELIALRTEGWEAAYRTNYSTARARFAELQRRAPNHPDGDLSLAAITWQEYLFTTRRLQSSVYRRNSSFYAGAKKSSELSEGDAVPAAVRREFQEHITRALRSAQASVDANPNATASLYFLGSAYGIRAAYEASAERRFWAALRDGVKAVKLHQKVIELDPSNYDAYLTLGTYHYAIGCIPSPFRAIATVMGIRGGKRRGLSELETVTQKGTYNRDDARSVLIALYRYEGNSQRALAELKEFSTRYPENMLLQIELASTLAQLRRSADSWAMFEALLNSPDRRVMDLVHYQYAEALALTGAHDRAAEHFRAVAHAPGAYAGLVTEGMVRAGQMYDLSGRRTEALWMYRASLERLGPDEQKIVERFIRQPFKLK